MMFCGIIDRRGKLSRNLNTNRIRFDEHGMGEYVVVFKDEYELRVYPSYMDEFVSACF
ncbi:MAG: hypothetical protein PWQ37_3008 [Candidatus Petromonas sp.]|nr:hypothetical protein [Candidatus Petromonas sp.]